MEKLQITQKEKEFILKAIWNITTLYDFDNTTGISKSDLIKESNELSEVLR